MRRHSSPWPAILICFAIRSLTPGVAARNSIFPTPTRSRRTCQVNTAENCTADRRPGDTSFLSLESACWCELRDMSATFIGFRNGIWPGTGTRTPRWHCKLPEHQSFHQMNNGYNDGACCIIRTGFQNFGLHEHREHPLMPAPPRSMAWTELYGHGTASRSARGRAHRRPITAPTCLGRTGRRWGCKQSLLRRKGRRRRPQEHCLSRFLCRWRLRCYKWTCGQILCPHALCNCCQFCLGKMNSRRSDGAGALFSNFAFTNWLARQLKQITGARQAIMSESDPEAPWTIGPEGEDATLESGAGPPAGPPPPTPAANCNTCHQVAAWQGLSRAFSGAIIQVLNTHYATPFTGRVLTYLPQELLRPFHGMRQVVVSVRPMRPHEETHPLILEVGDDEAETEEIGHGAVGEEGPRPPSTPPPAHLLRPEAGTEAMPAAMPATMSVPSPGEDALAAAIGDITSRMEAEGRSRMNAAEERLLNEIMDPVEDEEEIETTGPDTSTTEAGSEADPGSTTRATPKPRAKGTRKSLRWTSQLVCVLCGLFRKPLSAAPPCVLTHAGDSVSCNEGSESNVSQPSIRGTVRRLSTMSVSHQGLQTAGRANSSVTFGLSTFGEPIVKLGRRMAHKKSWYQRAMDRMCGFPALVIYLGTTIRYGTAWSLPRSWVGDLQWCRLGIKNFIRVLVFLLAGLFQYLGDQPQKQYTPSRQVKTDCKNRWPTSFHHMLQCRC